MATGELAMITSDKPNPLTKTALLQNHACQKWLACLQTAGDSAPEFSQATNELLVSMGANAYKRALTNYFSTKLDNTITLPTSADSVLTFFVGKQGSDIGRIFWLIDSETLDLTLWRNMLSLQQQKADKGRKKKRSQANWPISSEQNIELWHLQETYYAKSVNKNKKHVISFYTLLASMQTELAKQLLAAQTANCLLEHLEHETERVKLNLQQATADYIVQLKKISSLERAVESLRQVDKQMTRLIKLYLLALKMGANN